jgi:hypothetical protein
MIFERDPEADGNLSTNPEKLSKRGVIWFARSPFDVFLQYRELFCYFSEDGESRLTRSFVNQNLRTSSMRPRSLSDVPIL